MMGFLQLQNDVLTVDISPYGAALARVWIKGVETSLVLGLDRAQDYAQAPQAIGVIVGPVAGRVSGARTSIEGATYHMEPNTPPDCLHSGSGGVQNRLWQVDNHTSQQLTLLCELRDGDCGLPGNRRICATYRLENADLFLSIQTETDATTLVNLASHAYWVLDDSGSLQSHLLWVNSNQICETSAALIPTGRLLDTTGGDFDFATPRSPVAGRPLDGCFCLAPQASDDLHPVLRLASSLSGLTLEVDSNQPGVVLYTGAGLPVRQNPSMTPRIAPFSAIAIESQSWPDANNHDEFPSIVVKGETSCAQTTRFRLTLPR